MSKHIKNIQLCFLFIIVILAQSKTYANSLQLQVIQTIGEVNIPKTHSRILKPKTQINTLKGHIKLLYDDYLYIELGPFSSMSFNINKSELEIFIHTGLIHISNEKRPYADQKFKLISQKSDEEYWWHQSDFYFKTTNNRKESELFVVEGKLIDKRNRDSELIGKNHYWGDPYQKVYLKNSTIEKIRNFIKLENLKTNYSNEIKPDEPYHKLLSELENSHSENTQLNTQDNNQIQFDLMQNQQNNMINQKRLKRNR